MIEAQLNGRIKNKKRITKFVDDVFYHYFKNRMKTHQPPAPLNFERCTAHYPLANT